MTQNLLGFNELNVGAQIALATADRSVISGQAIDPTTLVGASTLFAETKFVAKNGNDATGDGSVAKPFLTIAAALASITDAASTKPYGVLVMPGVYTDTFQIKAWCYVQGIAPEGVFLNPVTANWIDASFAAGTQDGGISCVTLLTSVTVDFSLVASAGAATFKLADCFLGAAGITLTFKGNNSGNVLHLRNILIAASSSAALVLTNISSNVGSVALRNGALTITSTDAYAVTHRFHSLATGGAVVITWTGATTANSLTVIDYTGELPTLPLSFTITGAGASVYTRGVVQLTGPNADTTFSFGVLPGGGTVNGAMGAENIITANPTADRTYTFEGAGFSGGGAPTAGTRIRLVNQSTFNITIAYAGGASGTTGRPTYVGPFQTALFYATGALVWEVAPMTQFGAVQLNNGVSALIPADIDANSTITATLRTFNGATGIIAAKGADRVNGTRAGGGGFKLTSVTQAAGATVVTDVGTYDWHVVGLGAGT